MAGVKGVLRNVFTVSAFTALSRVLGLVREMLQSRLIGAGVAQSAFALAFALPNMARKLFGEGALTAAFVPVFKGEVESEGIARAARLARAVMTTAFLMLGALTALGYVAVRACASNPDWFCGAEPERIGLTADLVCILLPYMLFICGAAFGMGVLNATGRFKASAFMPCLLNILWIGALAFLAFRPSVSPEARIRFVAWAILAAGAVQMTFMLWRMRRAGVAPLPLFRGWADEKTRLVWRNTAIAALGAGAVQINCMLDTALAQIASPWAAGVIGYAERLIDLPLGVVATAFGTVLLPSFSGAFAKGDTAAARETFVSSTRNMLFVMIPASVGLAFLAPLVVEVVYRGGAFDDTAVTRVSWAVACYATGLAFFGLQKTLVPWFQAQRDMKTPLYVSSAAVLLNAAMNIAAVFCLPVEWRHVGLAASTVVTAGASCLVLAVLARRKNGPMGYGRLVVPVVKMVSASVVMMLCVWSVSFLWTAFAASVFSGCPVWFEPPCRLVALVAAGAFGYFAFSAAVLPEMRTAAGRFFRRRP